MIPRSPFACPNIYFLSVCDSVYLALVVYVASISTVSTYPSSQPKLSSVCSRPRHFTKVGIPDILQNRRSRRHREDDSAADGNHVCVGILDTETDVTVQVVDDNKCIEAGTQTGVGLLLDK